MFFFLHLGVRKYPRCLSRKRPSHVVNAPGCFLLSLHNHRSAPGAFTSIIEIYEVPGTSAAVVDLVHFS